MQPIALMSVALCFEAIWRMLNYDGAGVRLVV